MSVQRMLAVTARWYRTGVFLIIDDPLQTDAAFEAVRDPVCGAIATFVGTVRGVNDGREVARLEYEVHESMALKQFAHLATRLREDHGAWHIAIDHRRGVVEVGGVSVAIAVSSPRRRNSLAACAEAIEHLKRDVPIWKKEIFSDGEHRWVQGS